MPMRYLSKLSRRNNYYQKDNNDLNMVSYIQYYYS